MDITDEPAALHAAYNDSQGITERFIRNALDVLNHRVDARFMQSCFDYRAVWRPDAGFMDIGFVANRAHTVAVPGLDLEVPFRAGGVPARGDQHQVPARAGGG
ncbi:MAG: L-histidine N(alpha)-methyltransferase [Thermoleophilia bacterium]